MALLDAVARMSVCLREARPLMDAFILKLNQKIVTDLFIHLQYSVKI